MNNKSYILVSIICLIIIAVSLYTILSKPVSIWNLDVKFSIGDRVGLDVSKESLSYGTIMPGGAAVREIIISNNQKYNVQVKAFVTPEISDFLQIEQPLYVNSGEQKDVKVTISAPPGNEYGNYSGKLQLNFYKNKKNN